MSQMSIEVPRSSGCGCSSANDPDSNLPGCADPLRDRRLWPLSVGWRCWCTSDVTAQGTVASPARLPQPFQVAPDAGDLSNGKACLHYPDCSRKPPDAELDRFLAPSVSLATRCRRLVFASRDLCRR